MSETERIEATRDLVGSLSTFLDEFAACWGGLRVANDLVRSVLVDDLFDEVGARTRLAAWIECRLTDEHSPLIAPLVSLLWTSGGTTHGALQAFEVSIEPAAPVGAQRLGEALDAAFKAHLAGNTIGSAAISDSAVELLISKAAAEHRFGLTEDIEVQLDRATGVLWAAALDRGGYRDPGGTDGTLETILKTAGWRNNAVVAQAELVAIPGLELRHYVLTPLVAPHTVALLQAARGLTEVRAIQARIGPGLVTAWDSFAHTFGDEGDEGDEPDDLDDPFRVPRDYGEETGPEASHLLMEGAWFAGLLSDESTVPTLSGPARSLLVYLPAQRHPEVGDAHVARTMQDAVASLERLATNLGDPGDRHLAAFESKAERLRAVSASPADLDLIEYVLRVVEGIVAAAKEAAAFAQHLDHAEGERPGDVDMGLRLAAIVAWLDAVARWVVSDAFSPTPLAAGAAGAMERVSNPPYGYREPRKVVHDLVASLPERFPVEESRLVVEQREAQWDDLATLDDTGVPDLTEDCSDVVDIEGFANR